MNYILELHTTPPHPRRITLLPLFPPAVDSASPKAGLAPLHPEVNSSARSRVAPSVVPCKGDQPELFHV